MSNQQIDRGLQTLGGILLTICLAISGWALSKTVEHDTKLGMVEVRAEGAARDNSLLRSDISEMKADIKKLLERK